MPSMPATDMSDARGIDVEYLQGIHLVDSILWLDALRRAELCFVSHAHLDPIDPHRKVLTTEATAQLIGRRLGDTQMLVTPYRRPFSLGELDSQAEALAAALANLGVEAEGRRPDSILHRDGLDGAE